MKRISPVLLVCCILFSTNIFAQNISRDGKLLRGEKWQRFQPTEKADFYVATNGNDNWSGTLPDPNSDNTDGPFASLNRAQKAVRELKEVVYSPKDAPIEKRWIGSPHELGKGRDILVLVRNGFYSLQEPLIFKPEDGGERIETNLPTGAFEYHKLKDNYVTYAAYPGEKPVISGGVPVTNWKKKGDIWIAQYDADTAAMLIVNGKKQVLARTPNMGYFVPPAISEKTDELYFNPSEVKNWTEMDHNRVIMLLRWHTGINSIIKVDEKSGVVSLRSPQEGVVIVPPRYYIENVKALLDSAGEWYFDKVRNELSYIPSKEVDSPNDILTSVPVINQLVEVKGTLEKPVRNLRFYGLTFEGVTTGNSAISFSFAHACELVASEVRSCNGAGVKINPGCYQPRILDNHFETIEQGVIHCVGAGNPCDGREIIRETQISYNKIYDCGGINIYAAHTLMTTISHNYITKTRGRYAIDVGGWSNQEEAVDGGYLVEYNHLDDVQKDADDSGAIKTAGLTFNSIVRKNLIHNVHAGFFNDNVGFWFDNMSSGWTTEENIFYNLEQGEMKLCAALIEDNVYRNNFNIESPVSAPEIIIEGDPVFEESNLKVLAASQTSSGKIVAGSVITISADVFNSGSTGIAPVQLYVDGKIYEEKFLPVVTNNSQKVEFEVRIYDEGEHYFAVGATPYKTIQVEGEKPAVVYTNLNCSTNRILNGELIEVNALAVNLTSEPQKMLSSLYLNNSKEKSITVHLNGGESREVKFEIQPKPGEYTLRIENSAVQNISVLEAKEVDISKEKIYQYCSAKAKPYKIEADKKNNRFKITAGGSDFFHAEDSYAAAYVKGIKGDFVATVKINEFGNRTHEWFRSGLFVRNDISKSFDVQPGSKGSVLVFATPGRAGIEYDEFANGCMHKASSENLPENSETPIYLKIVRHGNSFSGYISLDGENWIVERHTTNIPGIAETVDLGLAAGGPDKNQYWVEFTDWKIEIGK
ncbi:hypothetical protein OU798_03670 [Prolixibacteraceae bacterium Z1-6]|uniref:Right handed beta helix domain-containing protein n=1 Tax=Draconibacterium aestuarii TaxID=2998507 RepID=A0A9X3FBD2_9BACT|nr:hypothetical protein [Prolixibacteraceae bacterium Z1-6]